MAKEIEVVEDEQDRLVRGMREERREIVERANKKAKSPTRQEDVYDEVWERDLDPTAVKDPSKDHVYYWANRTHSEGERVQIYEGHGYEVVTKAHKERPVVGVWKEGIGWCRGALILMRTTRENYERRQRRRRRRLEILSRAALDDARENINKTARDGGLASPHREAFFDNSKEEPPVMGPSAHSI
jgi:hypothetical protein